MQKELVRQYEGIVTVDVRDQKIAGEEIIRKLNKASKLLDVAQGFLCTVQGEIERHLDYGYDEEDYDALMKKLEGQIPEILLKPEVKPFLDIRKAITRFRMAKDPDLALKKLEGFYLDVESFKEKLKNCTSGY